MKYYFIYKHTTFDIRKWIKPGLLQVNHPALTRFTAFKISVLYWRVLRIKYQFTIYMYLKDAE